MDEIEPLMRERSDDVPMRLAQLEHMQVASLLDRHAWELARSEPGLQC